MAAAYVAGAQSLANALKTVHPDQAYAVAPWDAQVAARYARIASPMTADLARSSRSARIARRALQREAIAYDAVVTLGLDAQIRGDAPLAQRYLELAQRLTRRDFAVGLWSLENAVARGDVSAAITQYDVTLRTSREARQVLFPILASAITDPAIATALTRLLLSRPYWTPDFIFFLAKDSPDPRVAAAFFDRLNRAGVPISDPARSVLIESLVAKGDIDRAWSVYASHQPGADPRKSRDTHFVDVQDSRSPFDWQLFGDGGISTSIERGSLGNVLAFSVPPGAGGLLIRQIQLLPSGSYRLHTQTDGLDVPISVRPVWTMTCLDGRPIGQVPLANSSEADGVTNGYFSVPTDCRAQYLSLIARASDVNVTGNVLSIAVGPTL